MVAGISKIVHFRLLTCWKNTNLAALTAKHFTQIIQAHFKDILDRRRGVNFASTGWVEFARPFDGGAAFAIVLDT